MVCPLGGSAIDSAAMIHSLDQDRPCRRVQQGEQSKVSNPELAVLRGRQPAEETIGVGDGLLQLTDHSARDRRIEASEIPRRSLSPADRPCFQRLNRRLS